MWSLFSRDPTKDFGYDVDSVIGDFGEKSIWSLHDGKKKNNGEPVSVFAFDIKGSSESQVQLAKASFKRTKTLRHPNILPFIDGLETDKVLYMVTERVIPLEIYLKENLSNDKTQSELCISWGLHQVIKGLSFLINNCNLIHNNVCMSSIFVDRAGEWRLGGVDYVYPASGNDSIPPVKTLPALEKYDPPEKSQPCGARKPSEIWSSDMWGLGCLIWEIFNGTLPKTSALKAVGKIPKPLVPHYCTLVGANPRSRPNPAKFIENCRHKGGFMENQFVDTMLFLEEIQIKDAGEKIKFFNSLAPVLDSFPKDFCKHKILPQLLHAFEFGNAGSAVLTPLFKLGKTLDATEYQQKIVPCVIKMFSSTDRATRVKLLQQMEMFVEHLHPDVVNTQIFPNISQGFLDSNPVVREQTIMAMIHLAPKLNYKNLNEELLKHFARLQTKDDQGGIRTNTTICLGKVAAYLNPQSRMKILSSAYLRALKDPFPPAREAGVYALAAGHNYFTLQESGCRLLPALCALTMDPDKGVRDKVFKSIKCFLVKLEKVSENPELAAEMEKDVMSGSAAAASSSGWAGWAVSGMSSLTSKLVRSKSQGQKPQAPSNDGTHTNKTVNLEERSSEKQPEPTRVSPHAAGQTRDSDINEEDNNGDGWNDDGGWDDEEWGDMEDMSLNDKQPTVAKHNTEDESIGYGEPTNYNDGDGWDEDWGSIEEIAPSDNNKGSNFHQPTHQQDGKWSTGFTAEDKELKTTSSYNWDDDPTPDQFFSSMIDGDSKQKKGKSSSVQSVRQSKSPSPAGKGMSSTTKTTGDSGWESSGWDDSNWTDLNSQGQGRGMSKAEEAKMKREERRLQRQQELEEKRAARQASGAMKLGARKINTD